VPDQQARERILMVLAAGMRLDGLVDFAKVAKRTPVSLPAALPRSIIDMHLFLTFFGYT